jgi:hypothetical protein
VGRNEARAKRPRAQFEVGMSPTLKKGPILGPSIFIRSQILNLRPCWATIEGELLDNCRNCNLHDEIRNSEVSILARDPVFLLAVTYLKASLAALYYVRLHCDDYAGGVPKRPGSYRLDWQVPIHVATLHESSRPRRHKADGDFPLW